MGLKNYITVTEYARQNGLTVHAVRKKIHNRAIRFINISQAGDRNTFMVLANTKDKSRKYNRKKK